MEYNNRQVKELKQFVTPIWYSNQSDLLFLDSYCDKYIEDSQKNMVTNLVFQITLYLLRLILILNL